MRLLYALGMLSMLLSCTASEKATPSKCAAFLQSVSFSGKAGANQFDIERSLGTGTGTFVDAYNNMQSIASGCFPVGVSIDPPESIKSPWDAPPYIDVDSGHFQNTPWIQFVYPDIDEAYGPGLASSIVFYDPHGNAIADQLVSSYHAWEGARSMRSRISVSGTLEKCVETIEFYSYTESGDIDRELDVPDRSGCKMSQEPLPDGILHQRDLWPFSMSRQNSQIDDQQSRADADAMPSQIH